MTNHTSVIEEERAIAAKKCNIDQFRITVAEAASLLNTKMENFKLIVEISGNENIPDTYELEILNKNIWTKVKKDQNLCEIINALMEAVNKLYKAGKF